MLMSPIVYQSIRFKVLYDICVISETWLQDYDDYWIEACELNRDGYSMVTSHRMGRPGGRLACVFRNRFKVKPLYCGT